MRVEICDDASGGRSARERTNYGAFARCRPTDRDRTDNQMASVTGRAPVPPDSPIHKGTTRNFSWSHIAKHRPRSQLQSSTISEPRQSCSKSGRNHFLSIFVRLGLQRTAPTMATSWYGRSLRQQWGDAQRLFRRVGLLQLLKPPGKVFIRQCLPGLLFLLSS